MRIAAVILHYGNPQLTMRLQQQMLAADPQRAADIMVLDNCAPEPFCGAWQRTSENLYWAGALEYTLASVMGLGYTHLWFLNNDIMFDTRPPLLARAEARMARMQRRTGAIGVWAPAVVRSPYHEHMVADPRYQFRRVAYVDGIAPVISIDCWRQTGGVDYAGNPYGYGVDIWFSLCAHRAGWAVVVDNGIVVQHAYHSTARTVSGFLETAARAENEYLTARLGLQYNELLQDMKRQWTDEEHL
jgi:hypothetical protein